jgi:hypothetical protein
MPAPKTLSNKFALRTLRGHIVFTLGALRLFPMTEEHVPLFEGFLMRWGEIHTMELALYDAIELANNAVLRADTALNAFATKVSKLISTLTGEQRDQRKNPLYTVFFKNKVLSDFKRPILGGQYRAMTLWPTALDGCGHNELKALVPELVPLLATAKKAIQDKESAEQAKKIFREVGDRRKFFDAVNIARKTLYGELSSLPHKMPGLPSDFADQFFRRDVAAEDDEEEQEEPTLESVAARIEALAAELEAQKAVYKELEETAQREAELAKQIQADEEKLAAIEREAAARAKEAEELRARIAAQKK